jgi:hypothetical protein
MWLCTKDLFPEFWSIISKYIAGGSASDIAIQELLWRMPKTKQLVMGKIQKEL